MDFLASSDFWFLVATSLAKTLFLIFLVVLPMVSYSVYAERRVSALMQDRLGPNRTGFPTSLLGFKNDFSPFLGGLGQPVADALKLLLKEDYTPAHVNKPYYWVAPALAMIPALVTLAIIPFGNFFLGQKMVVGDINVGIIFFFAITSISVYGIVIGGWAANSKYPFLGGIRSTSQMLSYEISMGLSVVPLLMITGTVHLSSMVNYQVEKGWLLVPFTNGGLTLQEILLWIPVFISFIVFTIAMFAETNRLPFDLPESETELVSGYHTEYSSMKFALYFLGEYTAMIASSALLVTMFLGGWHLPLLGANTAESSQGFAGAIQGLIHIFVFFAKVGFLIFFFIWVRWTLPRFRYDQLMKIGWLWLFEIALVNIFLTAGILAFTR